MALATHLLPNTNILRVKHANGQQLTLDHFKVNTVESAIDLTSVADNEIIVRNLYLSLDPYVRLWFDEGYLPPSQSSLGLPLSGLCVGEVIASKATDKLPVGTLITANLEWGTFSRISHLDDPATWQACGLRILPAEARVKALNKSIPLSYYVSALGMNGLTAYAGLQVLGGGDASKFKPGQCLFVSSAAGAVGQLVGQLAKQLYGLRVIGSVGSDAKAAYLKEHQHFDEVFNYKTVMQQQQQSIDEALGAAILKAAGPQGVDYYFDLVGGEMLDAVLAVQNEFGAIVSVGMLSQENGRDKYGIKNLNRIVLKGTTIYGFIYWHHLKYQESGELQEKVGRLLETGKLHFRERTVDGIENAPQAFLNLINGVYDGGKVSIKVADL
ncbi:hypothetical protein DFQ26_003354 [Actinomortierella ambigua]|nr:hypothetical protein DFQ26_003354 [Actinomortierella ambigua]